MASATFKPMAHEGMQKGRDTGNNPDEPLERAKEAGAQALAKTNEAFEKAKQAGGEALDKAREAAREAAESVGQMAGQAVAAVGKKADDLTGAAGHSLTEAGDALAKKLPQEGFPGKASHIVTDSIHESGRYIEEHKLSGMAQDLSTVIRNHPIPTMLICLGLGFCLGRALKD